MNVLKVPRGKPNVDSLVFSKRSGSTCRVTGYLVLEIWHRLPFSFFEGSKDILFIFRLGKWDLPKGKIETGEKIIVGVNKFKSAQAISPPSFKINDAIRQLQINKLKSLKERRKDTEVIECLELVKKVAQSNENLMPAVINAVEHLCTLGEISDCLRGIFGEFR